jgi:hypothetical protein
LSFLQRAYDNKKDKGVSAEYGSGTIRSRSAGFFLFWFSIISNFRPETEALLTAMSSPNKWLDLAVGLGKCNTRLPAKVASRFPFSERELDIRQAQDICQPTIGYPSQAKLYANQAITCGDAVDQGGVTTRMVFEELVNVTRKVSRTCE